MKEKKFRLFDAVLAAVCIILVVEAAAPSAAIGNSQYFWWIFLLGTFFLPYGLVSAELGTTYSDEGGLFDWVKRAYGRQWGSRVAWYYWINFAFWMASLAVLFTSVIDQVFGTNLPLAVAIPIQLAFIWGVCILSLYSISENKLLINIGTAFKIILMVALGILGVYFGFTHGFANPVTSIKDLMPSFDGISFISVILFNFMGFEVVTTYVGDMPNPKQDIPRAIIWGGLAVTALYMLASFGIGVAVPVEEISASMGILDAMQLLLGSMSPLFITVIGIMLLFSMFSNQLSWAVGINFVARYCSQNGGGMPKVFGVSSKKSGAPIGAAFMDGILATVLVLLAPLMPSDGLFWNFFALNLVMLLLSYVPLFPAFLKLRKMDKDIERPYKVPGGPKLLAAVAYVPLALLCVALIFTVIPLNNTEFGDKIPLLAGSILGLASGELVVMRMKQTH